MGKLLTLSDDELAVLDGRCSADVQAEVDSAKARLAAVASMPDVPEPQAKFVADVVREAKTNGEIILRFERVAHCRVCGKSAGYARHARSGRYHSKGEINYSKPLYLNGVELASRFVGMTGHPTLGCCRECFDAIKPLIVAALEDVPAEVSHHITGRAPRFKKHFNAQCTACGWKGHEGQMGMLPTFMGDGYYPGECPQCHAKNLPLGRSVIKKSESKMGFTVVGTA